MNHVGLIGCGYISNKHIRTLARFTNVTLDAISDIRHDRMKEAALYYHQQTRDDNTITFYTDYNQLLQDPRIDIVIIAVMSGLHAKIAKQAISFNKHIMIEKPMALSLKDADELINLSCEKNRKIGVCHQLRYRPFIQKIKKLVEEGYFGKLYLGTTAIRLHRKNSYYTRSAWKGTWHKDGGMLINQGIHLVDLLVWLLGDIRSVYGEISTQVNHKETEDVATGIIQFKNQAQGMVEANTITKPENIGYYLSIFAEKGSICIGGKGFNELHYCYLEGYPNLNEELRELMDDMDEQYAMYNDFFTAIETNEHYLINAEEGKKALEAIFAIYQSSQTEERIYFPMKNFSTTDMLYK